MKKFLNTIKLNLYSFYSIHKIFCVILTFTFVYLITISLYGVNSSVQNMIILCYQGTKDTTENYIEFFKWCIHQFVILILIGNFVYKQIKERNVYVIPRIGSKKIWFYSIITSSLILSFIYYIIGFMLTIFYTSCFRIFNIVSSNMHQEVDLTKTYGDQRIIQNMFFLLCLSTFLIITIEITLILIFNSPTLAFTLVAFLICLSVELGNIYGFIDKWLPANQGIYIKHFISNYSFNWSMIYIICFIVIVLIIDKKFIVKNDLTNLLTN